LESIFKATIWPWEDTEFLICQALKLNQLGTLTIKVRTLQQKQPLQTLHHLQNDEENDEVVDAVLLWWRDGDGDLVDDLVDALTYLTENGPIWLLTPKVGIEGHVEPSDIQDAAPTAGLSVTSTFPIGANWGTTRLVARKSKK